MIVSKNASRREFLTRYANLALGVLPSAFISSAQSHPFIPTTHLDIRDAVDIAISNVIAEGFDDILPRPFEVDMLVNDDALRQEVALAVIACLNDADQNLAISPVYTVPIPKRNRGEYRSCALLEPLDAISYLTLAILVAKMTSRQQQQNTSFSNRFLEQDTKWFHHDTDFETFQAAVLSRLPEHSQICLVSVDIKDFYANISVDRLRLVLNRQRVDRQYVDMLLKMLSRWQRSIGGGLPIGPAASHILAEMFLIDLDYTLISDGIDYVRFMDDYRMFAPDPAAAQLWIEILDHRLGAEGLQLRSEKTCVNVVSRSVYAEMLREQGAKRFSVFTNFGQTSEPPPPPCPPSGCQRPRRPPPRADIRSLIHVDTYHLLMRLKATNELDLDMCLLFIEASYWRGELDLVLEAIDTLVRLPHCIPYLVDLLVQEGSNITAEMRASISKRIGKLLNGGKALSDLDLIKIAELLGCKPYKNAQALALCVQNMPLCRSPVTVRYLIEALGPDINPQTASVLAARFEHACSWERRAVMRLESVHLLQYQTVLATKAQQTNSDPFLRSLARDKLTSEQT